jgi:hypothetical protein
MDFVRCDACGAKAILAASQCPKCAEPLYVRNDRGDDVRLARCRSCHTYYPASREGCRWCPAVKRALPRWTPKAAAAVLAIAVGWGGWQFLPASSAPNPTPDVMTLRPPAVTRLASVAVLPSPATDSVLRRVRRLEARPLQPSPVLRGIRRVQQLTHPESPTPPVRLNSFQPKQRPG